MANIMIGEQKVSGKTMCFDDEDWTSLKNLASENGFNGISALIRGFLRATELHPKELKNFLEEAKEEGHKIQSIGRRREIIRQAIKRSRLDKSSQPKPFWEK